MEDIIYLRTGRDRAALHGGQHLGHYHERLSRRPALLGDLALDTRKVPEMNGISKVTPGDHDLIRRRKKFLQFPDAIHVFDLREEPDILRSRLPKRLFYALQITVISHKWLHDTSHAHLFCDLNVCKVRICQRRRIDLRARKSRALSAL